MKANFASSINLESRRLRKGIVAAALLILIVFGGGAGSSRAQSRKGTVDEQYNASIRAASVYKQSHVLKLKPLVPDANGEVTVATFTSYAYKLGPTQLGVDVWTTIVPEVQDRCRKFPAGKLKLDLNKLLGLPPAKSYTNFVVFSADAKDIFRPSPDPETDTEYPCADPSDSECGNAFPSNATEAHKAWIAGQSLGSYQIPGGYPWTHLGYTYYWGHGPDIYGASEYVVRKGSAVDVLSITSYQDYCKPVTNGTK